MTEYADAHWCGRSELLQAQFASCKLKGHSPMWVHSKKAIEVFREGSTLSCKECWEIAMDKKVYRRKLVPAP